MVAGRPAGGKIGYRYTEYVLALFGEEVELQLATGPNYARITGGGVESSSLLHVLPLCQPPSGLGRLQLMEVAKFY